MQQRPRKNSFTSRTGGAHFGGRTGALEPILEDDGEVPERPKLQFKEDRDKPIPGEECSPLYLDYGGPGRTPPWTHDARAGNEEKLSKTKTNTGRMNLSEQPKNEPSKTTTSDA